MHDRDMAHDWEPRKPTSDDRVLVTFVSLIVIYVLWMILFW